MLVSLTVYFGTGVDDGARSMSKHSMHSAIFLTEESLMVLSLLDIIYLHATITF
jgi:hypothetical protein